jgi:hypothetical protein
MNPLVVVCGVSKLQYAILRDRQPSGDADFAADAFFQRLNGFELEWRHEGKRDRL